MSAQTFHHCPLFCLWNSRLNLAGFKEDSGNMIPWLTCSMIRSLSHAIDAGNQSILQTGNTQSKMDLIEKT